MGVGIGILGFGTVGSGVCKALELNGGHVLNRTGIDLKIEKILVRDLKKKRAVDVNPELFTDDFQEVLNHREIGIVIEVMGGVEPAYTYVKACLEKGLHVVTANKALLAAKGKELRQLAENRGVALKYEASVAGAVPIINTLEDSLCGEQISQVAGIVNGTTNYILSRMTAEGLGFEEILEDAKKLGYAEADPTADVEAFDATYKLCILAKKAFGFDAVEDHILREGITKVSAQDIKFAKELGYAIKLLAVGKKDKGNLELRVHPALIPLTHPMAGVSGPFNAIFLKGNCFGEMMLYGRGAGDLPTASAVMGDVVSVLRQHFLSSGTIPYDFMESAKVIKKELLETERYIRLEVKSETRAIERIGSCFKDHSITVKSIKAMAVEGSRTFMAVLTEKVSEEDMTMILGRLQAIDEVVNVNSMIRVENEI